MKVLSSALERIGLELDIAGVWFTSASEGRVALGPVVLMTRGYVAQQCRDFMEMGMDAYAGGARKDDPPRMVLVDNA